MRFQGKTYKAKDFQNAKHQASGGRARGARSARGGCGGGGGGWGGPCGCGSAEDVDFVDEGPGEHDRHLTGELKQCPECGEQVFVDGDRCQGCGYWFIDDTPPQAKRLRWWITLGVVGLIASPYLMQLFRYLGF